MLLLLLFAGYEKKTRKKANNEVKTRNVHTKKERKKYMKDSIQHPRMDKEKKNYNDLGVTAYEYHSCSKC